MSGGQLSGGGGGGQLSYLALGFATIDPSVITWGSIVGGSIVGGSIVAVPFGNAGGWSGQKLDDVICERSLCYKP